MLVDFLKDEDGSIKFTGECLEFYIPESYFESKLAENYGSAIHVFGLFNARLVSLKGVPGKLETFNMPSMIDIYPTDGEMKELQLIADDDEGPQNYFVARFYKGNKVMNNSLSQDASNVELFLDILCRGKIPKTIPYSQVLTIWHKNLEYNGVKLGVTSTVLEMIISEIYRDKKKPELAFAKVIGKDRSVSEYAYRTANIREICARNSTFAALTFEDMDAMITSSLNINKQNKQETESPIEKIIKM